MITTDDINKWFGDTFKADSTLSGYVPGVWFQRAYELEGQPNTTPYAVFNIVNTDTGPTVGSNQFPRFKIEAKIYTDQNITGVDPVPIVQRMQYVFCPSRISRTLRNGRIVEIIQTTSDEKFSPKLRQGNDILMSSFSWELECETSNLSQ